MKGATVGAPELLRAVFGCDSWPPPQWTADERDPQSLVGLGEAFVNHLIRNRDQRMHPTAFWSAQTEMQREAVRQLANTSVNVARRLGHEIDGDRVYGYVWRRWRQPAYLHIAENRERFEEVTGQLPLFAAPE